MLGADEVMAFVLPVPPMALIRKKEFPDCPELFVQVARDARKPREVGRIFALLCRLTGFAWLIWAVNTLLFSSVIIIVLYHFGTGQPLGEPLAEQHVKILTCQMLVAIMLALLFVGKMMFFTSTVVSLQLADRCHECAGINSSTQEDRHMNTVAKTGGHRDPDPS
jgi:hypothetical protein